MEKYGLKKTKSNVYSTPYKDIAKTPESTSLGVAAAPELGAEDVSRGAGFTVFSDVLTADIGLDPFSGPEADAASGGANTQGGARVSSYGAAGARYDALADGVSAAAVSKVAKAGFAPANKGNGGEGNPAPGGNGSVSGTVGGNPDKGGFAGAGNPDKGTGGNGNGNGEGGGDGVPDKPDDAGNPDKGTGGNGNGEGGGDGVPDKPDDAGNPGKGNGDGTGGGDGISDKPAPAPTPPDALVQDPETADWVSTYTFNLGDITLGWNGELLKDNPDNINMDVTRVSKEGVELHPIDSAFGFYVTDFIGAQGKVWDGDYGEGWVGELEGGGIAVADAPTDKFSTPARLGTWLEGIGGNFVKASTEHYSVMQAILSDQKFPGDDSGYYQLDDDLWVVDYLVGEDGMPVDANGDPSGKLVEDVMHHFYLKELIQALEEAETGVEGVTLYKDFDRDGVDDVYSAYMSMQEIDGVMREVASVDIGNDGIDYYDLGLNGFGTYGLQDILAPNESSIIEDIAVGDDYSVTVKDDGKLLYRWGNAIKRPNDIRIDAKMPLPEEWATDDDEDGFADALFHVTAAELLVNHTVTNNPNDQIRPEDFENEAAIGRLPSFVAIVDPFDPENVLWVSTAAYYSGDGTFLDAYLSEEPTTVGAVGLDGALYYVNVDADGNPVGTVLRDFSLIDQSAGSDLDEIGALSSDLSEGYTEAWYTTMDREPFMAVLNEDGEYEIGPRWRLQPDKYGQDLPSVIIPQDPSDAPPVQNGEEQYEVGADTVTVLNLLDWDGTSPLALSAGWMSNSGEVSDNGLNMTDAFDVAFYVKGDSKPVNLYDAQLVLEYEEVEVNAAGAEIIGTIDGDVLVGRGGNTFDLSGAAHDVVDQFSDIIVLGYGATTAAEIGFNEIYDFDVDMDAFGLIGFDLDPDNYNIHITQEVDAEGLDVWFDDGLGLGAVQIATLYGVDEHLEVDDFYFA